MDERGWLTCEEPVKMLKRARFRSSARKSRLFAVACCRRIWPLLVDERSRCAVEVAERYADGIASDQELAAAAGAAHVAHDEMNRMVGKGGSLIECAAAYAAHDDPFHGAKNVSWMGPAGAAIQAALVRCIFGNPFRPVVLNPAWQTSDVLSLAQTAYDGRLMPVGTLDLERLAVLADALEDAGCTNDEVLGHLRGSVLHVRGCWIVVYY